MFQIDLLKGEGIPVKSRPQSIAFTTIMIAVPLIIAAAFLVCYVRNEIVISIQKDRIANYDFKISQLDDAVEFEQSIQGKKRSINAGLSEVSQVLSSGRHVKWSPVLVSLVENMPDSVILTGIEVKERIVNKQVPRKDDPKKMVQKALPLRTLQLALRGAAKSNCDEDIKAYRSRLYSSDVLAGRLDNIGVSQKMDTIEGREYISYQIDCVFKPGL